MSQAQILQLVMLAYLSLMFPLLLAGVTRWRASPEGPVRLLGQVCTVCGGVAVVGAIVAFLGIVPTAWLLVAFAISFGMGAYILSAFLAKGMNRMADRVMAIWAAVAVTLILVRVVMA
ncbi:MAG: hypothetical protein ACPGID_07065 [Rubricella sp.]